MPAPTGFQKAKLQIEGGDTIECWFNPKEYSISKTNTWNIKPRPGQTLPNAQFGGGGAREMTLDLMFDSSVPRQGGGASDVKAIVGKLFNMMEVNTALGGSDPNSGRPPKLTFSWGATQGFQAVVKSLAVQYVLFKPDGNPIRATAKIALAQVGAVTAGGQQGGNSQQAGTNPTTYAKGALGIHRVQEGDSLQAIAYRTYGDPNHWRDVAEANGIDDPMRLRRGREIVLPRIEG